MLGAPALAAGAALRSGAGLAKLAVPAPILAQVLTICPSATGIPIPVNGGGAIEPHEAAAAIDRCVSSATCLAIGPGLGISVGAQAAVLRAVQQDEVPVVIDADAINALAEIPEFMQDFHGAAVFTPHPGEFKRLVSALGLRGGLGLAKSREAAAQALAQRLGAIVVLKGSGTVVTDGQRVWTNSTGHPCMATAGTGDVLTGTIAGLIAQFVPTPQQVLFRTKVPAMPVDPARPLDLFDAARIAVHAHGRAGELWAEENGAGAGLLAADLVGLIPKALGELRAG
jgi:NAD(P)H-hydrate epimerase